MSLNKIKQLLQQRIGLNPESIGESSISRAISHRLSVLKIDSSREYLQLLAESTQELNELIEEVVVPETWFFRNKTPFDALGNYIKKQILPTLQKKEPIKILSAPCSTGEEPYSISIIMLECGVPVNMFKIDAIDISKRALTKARRGIYGKNSFRDVEDKIIDKYFAKIRSGQQLNEEVRKSVNFKLSNFLVGSLSPHPGYYDIIFCRNLLIYFNREIQHVALEKLHRSLKESGILFVGHAETSQMSKSNFEKYEHPHSFAYIKKQKTESNLVQSSYADTASRLEKVPKEWHAAFNHISQLSPFIAPAQLPVKKSTKKSSIKPGVKKITASISPILIEKLANEGKYDKALMLCQEYIKTNPESAQAYYLLGMIHHSQSNLKFAESSLKKAIYLDPNHEQAMTLSMLLAQERGDKVSAESFKRRIQRIKQRNRNKS